VKAIPRSGKHPNGHFNTVLVIVGDMVKSMGVFVTGPNIMRICPYKPAVCYWMLQSK